LKLWLNTKDIGDYYLFKKIGRLIALKLCIILYFVANSSASELTEIVL